MSNDTGSIVEHVDPFKNILPGLFSSDVAPMIYELRFQRMKELSTTALSQQFPRRLMLAIRP